MAKDRHVGSIVPAPHGSSSNKRQVAALATSAANLPVIVNNEIVDAEISFPWKMAKDKGRNSPSMRSKRMTGNLAASVDCEYIGGVLTPGDILTDAALGEPIVISDSDDASSISSDYKGKIRK
jgi:hypothetical protein